MQILKLNNQTARKAAIAAIQNVPDGWVMRLSEPKRTLPQNDLMHAEIQELLERVRWAGELRSKDTWKRLLVAGWMRATDRKAELLPAIDGQGFDVIYHHTSELTVAQMNELISYIQAWKAERPEFQFIKEIA